MKPFAHLVLGTAVGVCLLGVGSLAADWPNWRGPNAGGVAPDRILPVKWSATDNVAWKATIAGAGVSTPIVSGDRVYVTSQIGAGVRREGNHPRLVQGADAAAQGEKALGVEAAAGADPSKTYFVVEAFGRADGQRVWEQRIEATGELTPVHDKHNLATPSPVTDGTLVFAWFGTGQIVALDRAGAVVWQRHLAKENGAFDIQWGHGSSPVLYGDLLILLCDQPARSYLLALDKKTGKDTLEGGPRPGTLVLQHTARRRGRVRRRGHRQLDRAHRRLRREDGRVPLAHRGNQPLCGAVAGVPRGRDLRQPRVSQRPVHGDQTRRARGRHRDPDGLADRDGRTVLSRHCSTTTVSSTWPMTSAC